MDREVNAQLLQELDGIKTTDARPVFVLASTNRLELIDPAILERFTERIEIPLPGENERWLLLEIFIGKIPLEVPAVPDGDNEIEAQLKALGYEIEMVGIDLATIRLGSSGKRTFLNAYNRSSTLLEAWDLAMTPEMVLARIPSATEGYSGRQLKNMVSKATMKAVKRAGPQGIATLRESDFDVPKPKGIDADDLDALVLPSSTKQAIQTYCNILTNHRWYSDQG